MSGLDSADSNSLYYLTGWSLKVVNNSCDACCISTLSSEPLDSLVEHSKLTVLKEYKLNALRHPTAAVFEMVHSAELVFRQWQNAITEVKNVKEFMFSKFKPSLERFSFPPCHGVKEKVLNKYLSLRLHIACARLSQSRKDLGSGYLGSKSMAMRKLVKRMK